MTDTASNYRHPLRSPPVGASAVTPARTPFRSPPVVSTPATQLPPPQARQREASPNYFGYQSDSNAFTSDSPRHVKHNWSPPSSAVRSIVADSPSIVPVDQNPAFDAFRRQSDTNAAFNMAALSGFHMSVPGKRPPVGRTPSGHTPGLPHSVRPKPRDVPMPAHRAQLELDTSTLSRSPKRMLSSGALGDAARRGSPPRDDERACKSPKESVDSFPRIQLPLDTHTASAKPLSTRTAVPPPAGDAASDDFIAPEALVDLLASNEEDVLLLDLRVSTQYATAHIAGALSLCIPTTLLKRPTFDVRKLADTFRDEQQRRRFENWRNCGYIVVYDASSAALKDATTCSNTIKKFRSEGYEGTLRIVRGGFAGFARQCPEHVERGVDAQPIDGDGPEVAPVVGGCPMPSTDAPVNPFFGNIRQNMDLIGGVGQIALQHPAAANTAIEEHEYPPWLREAANAADQGARVSQKFEQIERREQSRMQAALSGRVSYGTPRPAGEHDTVQIAGLEKGSKNRYNNIWPFEHSRVKLQGVASHGCDYFNASHIKASRSHKSYISTQAPIPATFNDFWNVVWQQDVRVIVMLTAEKEGAQVKAHNYWDQRQYGPLHLDFLSEKRASLELSRIHKHQRRPSALQRHATMSSNPQIPPAPLDTSADDSKAGDAPPFVTVRKFTLKHDKFPFEPMREITQLQYSGWPDFGAPAHPAHLLGLVEQCDAVVRATNKTRLAEPEPPHKRPILVHCSAGCGRTGTFCTVDSVIDMLKRQRLAASDDRDMHGARSADPSPDSVDGSWVQQDDLDLVERTVEDFRLQRLSMVQSLRQYVLCYESIMEWLVEQEVSPVAS